MSVIPATALQLGLYEQLLDIELADALAAQPELKTFLGKLDDEDAPHAYSQFVSRLLAHALAPLTLITHGSAFGEHSKERSAL
jgi:hypothetical protein